MNKSRLAAAMTRAREMKQVKVGKKTLWQTVDADDLVLQKNVLTVPLAGYGRRLVVIE
jgi:hypothetical protein